MRCKNCKDKFEQYEFNNKFCKKEDCQYEKAIYNLDKIKKAQDKEWKQRKKETKEKLKTKKDYEKELETIFNKYIRERDKHLSCISCGAEPGTYKLTAGHFYPAGSYKNLRFHEDNVQGQCWFNCNKNRHGNLHEYRINLNKRIGTDRVEELDRLARVPRHYTIPELIELKEIYKEKIRKL
jgi:hypothetical protein